jgi:hypothetical protein
MSRRLPVGTMDRLDDILQAGDLLGVLGRDVTVRMLNVSGSGCLVESASPIEPGTTGVLSLRFDGQEYSDPVRITRCQQIEGAGATYRMGAEFLWTAAPGERSLRRVASRLQQLAERGGIEVDIALRRVM